MTAEQELNNEIAVKFMGLKTEGVRRYSSFRSINQSITMSGSDNDSGNGSGNCSVNGNGNVIIQNAGSIYPECTALSAPVNMEAGWYTEYYRVLNEDGTPLVTMYLPGGYGDTQVPKYSSDTEAAMQVLNKLRDSGKYCCIDIKSDYNFCWDIWLTPCGIENLKEGIDDMHEPCIIVTSENLPTAICQAALESLISEEKEIVRTPKRGHGNNATGM